ncbi:MAG: type II toxin-antitoxin system HicA family toxin [Bacteroidota bacterium]
MKASELLQLLRRAGWEVERQRGSHMKLTHPQRADFIIFPYHGSKELGKGLEKKIRKQAALPS